MPNSPVIKRPAKPVRAAWVAPRVDKIAAGQAEVGTRASNDGAFSTS